MTSAIWAWGRIGTDVIVFEGAAAAESLSTWARIHRDIVSKSQAEVVKKRVDLSPVPTRVPPVPLLDLFIFKKCQHYTDTI